MQLKIRRSQRDGGVIAKTAVFCIDARVQFTAQESHSIARYKLQSQIIYDSEAAKTMMARSEAARAGGINYSRGIVGMFTSAASNALSGTKSLAYLALATTKLRISIGSLERGQRVECKSLDELMGAEAAIMEACENLKGYLDTAATFDGREVLFDFATGSAQAVAMSVTPEPMLIVEPQYLPAPMLAIASSESSPEHDEYSEAATYDGTDSYPQQKAMPILDQIKRNTADIPVPMWIAAVVVMILLYVKFG